jgi:hypothetical protein
MVSGSANRIHAEFLNDTMGDPRLDGLVKRHSVTHETAFAELIEIVLGGLTSQRRRCHQLGLRARNAAAQP